MNGSDYAYLERAANFQPGHRHLSVAYLEWDGEKPILLTADGYRIHAVWPKPDMVARMGRTFPFARSWKLLDEELKNVPSMLPLIQACQPDIHYLLTDVQKFRRVLKACVRSGEFDTVSLMSYKNRLFLLNDSGITFIDSGQNQPDGLIDLWAEKLLDTLGNDPVKIGWSTTNPSMIVQIGMPGVRCAYLMPLATSVEKRDGFFARYAPLAKALETALL